jgi:hypothetical protein
LKIKDKIITFLEELRAWYLLGMPRRSKERIAEIYGICKQNKCGFFENTSCGMCGCPISDKSILKNKIMLATTECPHENKYWGPEEGLSDKKAEVMNKKESVNIRSFRTGGGGGCGCK